MKRELVVWEIKKLLFPPLLPLILLLFLGIDLMTLWTGRENPEVRRQAETLAVIRSEEGIRLFSQTEKDPQRFETLLPLEDLYASDFTDRDFGLGRATSAYFADFFQELAIPLMIQGAILSLLITVVLIGTERETDMEKMIASSLTGRRFVYPKLAAGLVAVFVCTLLLALLSFLGLYIKIGLPEFFDIRMDCPYLHHMMKAELYPYVRQLSFWQYGLLLLLMIQMLLAGFFGLMFAIVLQCPDIPRGIGGGVLLVIADLSVSGFLRDYYPEKTWQGSFGGMYLTIRFWLTDKGGTDVIRYQEFLVILCLLLLATLVLKASLHRFEKKEQ